jgi:hypothetical protein
MTATKLLIWVLRITGTACLLAVGAMFMPREWMDFGHRFLGLGPLPAGPMFEHLARLTSALYAQFGGLLWVLSTNVRRYARAITYVAWTTAAMSAALLLTGLAGGMPLYWLLTDLAAASGFGLVVLLLQGRMRAAERATA